MRALAVLSLLILAPPAVAQLDSAVLPNTGYDIGYGAATLGLGAEVGWTAPDSPVTIALRPSLDYVFVDRIPYAVPYQGGAGDVLGREYGVVRFGAEAVVHWRTAPGPVVPYVKVGLAREVEQIRTDDVQFDYAATDGVAGLGASWGRLYLEGTHGVGDASRNRLAIGVRL